MSSCWCRTLPAVVVHTSFLLGVEPTDDEFVARVIDNVILPAARGPQAADRSRGRSGTARSDRDLIARPVLNDSRGESSMSENTRKADPPEPSRAGSDDAVDTPAEDNGHGHRHLGIALALICMAQLMVVLDGTIVNIALPHIKDDLGFTDATLPWVVNAYALAFGGLLLLGGRMGDILGRRKVFMFGVVLFGVASFFGGIAQSETRAAGQPDRCRVSRAAAASPNALALITTTFPAGKERNRAMAVYAAMSGAGAAVGLILGGVLTEASWRWTFFINTPIGLLVAVLAIRVPRGVGPAEGQVRPAGCDHRHHRSDLAGLRSDPRCRPEGRLGQHPAPGRSSSAGWPWSGCSC